MNFLVFLRSRYYFRIFFSKHVLLGETVCEKSELHFYLLATLHTVLIRVAIYVANSFSYNPKSQPVKDYKFQDKDSLELYSKLFEMHQ